MLVSREASMLTVDDSVQASPLGPWALRERGLWAA